MARVARHMGKRPGVTGVRANSAGDQWKRRGAETSPTGTRRLHPQLPAGNKNGAGPVSKVSADPCNKVAPTRYQSGTPLYAEQLIRKSLVRTVSQNTGGERRPVRLILLTIRICFLLCFAGSRLCRASFKPPASSAPARAARQVGPHLRTRGGWQTERGGIGSFNRGRR